MRTPQDVILSLQRYTALILPEPWNVRLLGEDMNQPRPFAYVSQNGPVTTAAGSFGAHSIRSQGSFTIHAYLPAADTREGSEDAAQELQELFWQALVLRGVGPATRGQVVPLWDFTGTGTVNKDDPPRQAPDFAVVAPGSFQTRSIPDPANPRLRTVTCDLRLLWWRAGYSTPKGTPLSPPAIRVTPGHLAI